MVRSQIAPAGYSPTLLKRIIGEKLTAVRKECGMTTKQACEQMGWALGTLSSVERFTWVKVNSDMVADLCDLYGVEGDERAALLDMARNARKRGWWRKHTDVFPNELPGFEAAASRILNYEVQFIPGLLQTADYVRLSRNHDESDSTERYVRTRIERQQILYHDEDPCVLHAVVEEGALLRITDERVRWEQIDHLLDMAARPNVTVQVIPLDAGIYHGIGEAFMLLSFPQQMYRDIVYLETAVDSRFLEELDESRCYSLRYDTLCRAALTPESTCDYLRRQIE